MNRLMDSWRMLKLSARIVGRSHFLLGYLACSILSVGLLIGLASSPVIWNLWRASFLGAPSAQAAEVHWMDVLLPYATVDGKIRVEWMGEEEDGKRTRRRYETASLEDVQPRWGVILPVAAILYFLSSFTVIFFNVALLASVRRIMNGSGTGFQDGIRHAWSLRRAILGWALIASTVALVLDILRSASDHRPLNRLWGVAGLSWRLATFLLIPVLAVEGGSPRQVVLRSWELFRRTWGQAVAGSVGIGAITGLVALVAVPAAFYLLGKGFFAYFLGNDMEGGGWLAASPWLAGSGSLLLLTALVALAGYMVQLVFEMALYLYATEGVIPEEYQEQEQGWFVAATK